MVHVTVSPEGITSFRRLPPSVKEGFDHLLLEMTQAPRLRLPGHWDAHALEGGDNLWTLKVGIYRGVFRWDGHEARFVRFGPRRSVYERLPK